MNRSVSPYRAGHMSERRDRVTSSLSNFRDRRNRSNQNTSPHPDRRDLFSDHLFRYVAIVRPLLFWAEMIPPHANSVGVNSHDKLITRVKKKLGYYVPVTDRLPSCFCGYDTHRDRWFLPSFLVPGPPRSVLIHYDSKILPASDILDPIDSVASTLIVQELIAVRARAGQPTGTAAPVPR